jgi:hypothetical protein
MQNSQCDPEVVLDSRGIGTHRGYFSYLIPLYHEIYTCLTTGGPNQEARIRKLTPLPGGQYESYHNVLVLDMIPSIFQLGSALLTTTRESDKSD